MPASSPTSNAPLLIPIQQLPVDESARHTPSTLDGGREALIKLVDDLQKAALPEPSLRKLGALIMGEEPNPCAKSLAMLLHPPAEPSVENSCKHGDNHPRFNAEIPKPPSLPSAPITQPTDVSQPIDPELAQKREAQIQAAYALWRSFVSIAPPPRSLIEFAADYRDEHPDEYANEFFRPFGRLAEFGIQIPEDIALVFKREILPFDTFRRMVRSGATRLSRELEESRLPLSANAWNAASYWEHVLAALCSPLAMALLDSRKLSPETLLDRTGLTLHKEALDPGRTTQSKESSAPSEFSEPFTMLLANSHLLNDGKLDRSITSKAALLKDPEKLCALADSLTPRAHIVYLLSIADSVDGSVLEQEMGRVAKQNALLNAGKSAEERARYYSEHRLPSPDQYQCLEDSYRNMAPYMVDDGKGREDREARIQAAYTFWKMCVSLVPPPRSLIEFGVDYQREHPGENINDFFRPFSQLVERGIRIPADIALIFTRKVLPFDTFRKMVQTDVTQLTISTQEKPGSSAHANGPNDASDWEHVLAALCSPLAMAFLDGQGTRPEDLLDWTGLKKRTEIPGLDRTTPSAESAAPSEFIKPITMLLATWDSPSLSDSRLNRSRTPKAAFLKSPEKFLALADNFVPRMHIAYLLSIADSVDWPVLEQEMDRVAKLNGLLNAGKSAEERARYYRGACTPSPEQSKCMLESRRIMEPYLTVNGLCADKRLDTWTVVKASGDDRDAQAHLERHPARALFQYWTENRIPVEHQVLMGKLMAQGFDQAWAQKVVEDHAGDLSRVQALSVDLDADLYFRLDDAMVNAVTRWLADEDILRGLLSLVPTMIQSDMSVAQIESVLRDESLVFLLRQYGISSRRANIRNVIRYGLCTSTQLLALLVHGNDFDEGSIVAELNNPSEWRKKAAETRDRLRGALRAAETLRAGMTTDTPQASQCEFLANNLKDAIVALGNVLQPEMDTRWAQEGQEINDKLAALVADLSFRTAGPANHASANAAELRQFV